MGEGVPTDSACAQQAKGRSLVMPRYAASFPRHIAALVLFAIAPVAGPAFGEDQQHSTPPIIFLHINEVVPPGSFQLSNGIVVDRRDWPTLIMARIPRGESEKPATCTATLVGPNVVLLAAHCVDTWQGKPRRAELWAASRKISMTCEMHPGYVRQEYQFLTPRGSEDYALCLMNDNGMSVFSFSTIRYEVIDAETALDSGSAVVMTGYGCEKLTVEVDGQLNWKPSRGALGVGDQLIEWPTSHWLPAAAYITSLSQLGKQPALCPGDSGGPLFTGVTAHKPDGVRRIRGVNSMICVRRRGDKGRCTEDVVGPATWDIISSFSATGLASFRAWASDWVRRNADNNPVICGINWKAGQEPCRD
jgi:hypothetical protein